MDDKTEVYMHDYRIYLYLVQLTHFLFQKVAYPEFNSSSK